MNIKDMHEGMKLDLELINSSGEKIGQTFISQVEEIVDDNSIIVAAPIHESRLMLIPSGTRVRIVFYHRKYGLIGVTGVIKLREKRENIVVLHVALNNDFDKIQRRQYFRLSCNLDSKYYLFKSEEIEKESAQKSEKDMKKSITRNISGSGACVLVEESIPKDSVIEVVLWLTRESTVKVVGKVIRSTLLEDPKGKRYELGLHFTKISHKDQEVLVKYIFEQQRLLLKNNLADKV